MMASENEFLNERFRELKGNIFRVSRESGISLSDIKSTFAEELYYDPYVHRAMGPIPKDITTLGKEGMRHWVIAIKPNGDVWPDRFLTILYTARKLMDEGTHIMCQGKHRDGWTIQYLVKRKVPLKQPIPFFNQKGV